MDPRGTNTLGDFLAFAAARLLLVHDAWSGMSETSPHVGVYELRRTPSGALVGDGSLFQRGECIHTQALQLAKQQASRVLRLLAEATVATTPYEPAIEHTDDFPNIEIAVHIGPTPEAPHGGIAFIATSSQGELHAPWRAVVRGDVFTLSGEHVGRALGIIRALMDKHTGDGGGRRSAGSKPPRRRR